MRMVYPDTYFDISFLWIKGPFLASLVLYIVWCNIHYRIKPGSKHYYIYMLTVKFGKITIHSFSGQVPSMVSEKNDQKISF